MQTSAAPAKTTPAQPAQGNTDLQAELAALKKQVVDLTQKLSEVSNKPSLSTNQVFHLDTAVPKVAPNPAVKPKEKQTKKPVRKVKKTTAENRKQVYQSYGIVVRNNSSQNNNNWHLWQNLDKVNYSHDN